ncbi:MAG: glycosyltransferase, partial [Desulfobacterales bacterium]|nr:glycosyltransferase [Desulfobacterales bacterium]
MISVIIPTYNEADNMRLIIPELSNLFLRENMKCEIIVVDDNSPDGTAGIVAELGERYPVRVHVRRGDRGLSRAVIEGFE